MPEEIDISSNRRRNVCLVDAQIQVNPYQLPTRGLEHPYFHRHLLESTPFRFSSFAVSAPSLSFSAMDDDVPLSVLKKVKRAGRESREQANNQTTGFGRRKKNEGKKPPPVSKPREKLFGHGRDKPQRQQIILATNQNSRP